MTNVLEWLEHMEAQSGEKIASCRIRKKNITFTQVKNVCTERAELI